MRRRAKITKPFSYYLERKDEFNVLFPSERLVTVSSLFVLRPEIVQIDPDPSNGDVYQLQHRGDKRGGFRDEFVITKHGLQKIARAAGIRFDPTHTRRSDDGRNPRRVEFQAVGSIQKPDGSWYSVCRSKEIHLDVIEQELRDEIESAAKSEGLTTEIEGEQRRLAYGTEECAREITQRIEREMLKRRKNMVATADSGAYSRVVRSLLNLQTSYSHDELQRPFAVPSVAVDLERLLDHSWARQGFINAGLDTMISVFGPMPGGSALTEGSVDRLRREAQEGESKKA
jgi:hypothetical protein